MRHKCHVDICRTFVPCATRRHPYVIYHRGECICARTWDYSRLWYNNVRIIYYHQYRLNTPMAINIRSFLTFISMCKVLQWCSMCKVLSMVCAICSLKGNLNDQPPTAHNIYSTIRFISNRSSSYCSVAHNTIYYNRLPLPSHGHELFRVGYVAGFNIDHLRYPPR